MQDQQLPFRQKHEHLQRERLLRAATPCALHGVRLVETRGPIPTLRSERPSAVQDQRMPTPSLALCPETSNSTMRAKPPPLARPGFVRTWPHFHGKARRPDGPFRRWGCGSALTHVCDAPETGRPSLRIAATAARCLPMLVAAGVLVLLSAHGQRTLFRWRDLEPIPTVARASRELCLGAVRSTCRQGSGQTGAKKSNESCTKPERLQSRTRCSASVITTHWQPLPAPNHREPHWHRRP